MSGSFKEVMRIEVSMQWVESEQEVSQNRMPGRKEKLTTTPRCAPVQLFLPSSHRSICIVTRCPWGQISAPVISVGPAGSLCSTSVPAPAIARECEAKAGHSGVHGCHSATGHGAASLVWTSGYKGAQHTIPTGSPLYIRWWLKQ